MRPLYSLLKKELKFTEKQSENSFNFQKDQRTFWNIHKIMIEYMQDGIMYASLWQSC